MAIAVVAVVSFAPLNAPVEEPVYRGYAQGSLARRWPVSDVGMIPVSHLWTTREGCGPSPLPCSSCVKPFVVDALLVSSLGFLDVPVCSRDARRRLLRRRFRHR